MGVEVWPIVLEQKHIEARARCHCVLEGESGGRGCVCGVLQTPRDTARDRETPRDIVAESTFTARGLIIGRGDHHDQLEERS